MTCPVSHLLEVTSSITSIASSLQSPPLQHLSPLGVSPPPPASLQICSAHDVSAGTPHSGQRVQDIQGHRKVSGSGGLKHLGTWEVRAGGWGRGQAALSDKNSLRVCVRAWGRSFSMCLRDAAPDSVHQASAGGLCCVGACVLPAAPAAAVAAAAWAMVCTLSQGCTGACPQWTTQKGRGFDAVAACGAHKQQTLGQCAALDP